MRKQIGIIGIDAGLCWIGDPCYIHPDKGEEGPKDFGKSWDDFCDNIGKKNKGRNPTMAQFNYDMGHAGLGVCVSTGYGDGSYPVYAEIIKDRVWGRRIKSVTIVFIENSGKSAKLMNKIAAKSVKKKGK
jgi:hypothetical protein